MDEIKVITVNAAGMGANCYILRDSAGDGAIVDPGVNAPQILAKCRAESVNVKYIFLTHAHFDHILSLEAVREATDAQVCIHRYDADALTDPNLSYMAQFAGLNTPCKPAEILLDDGDIINLGASEIEILHTPGHTAGSVCYKGNGFIVTGDTLFYGTIGRCDFFGGDEAAMFQSLGRLKKLAESGDYKIFPGHGSPTTLSREIRDNLYMK